MSNIRGFALRTSIRMLPLRYKRTLFLHLAKALGVSKIRIKGDYGEISGFVDDAHVFGVYLRDGVWSEHINRIFIDYFASHWSGTFLDIGANIGLTTVPVAKNRHVFCHAFEPDPASFELLQENIRCNVGANVQLHNLALFSDATPLTLALSADNRGNHMVCRGISKQSSHQLRERERKTITVRGAPLDGVLDRARIELPLVIKIDAEGSEYHIYKGGRNIVRLADLVVMEYWPYGIKTLGGDTDALIRMMMDDFRYAAILDEDAPLKFDNLTDCSSIACELRNISERAPEMEFADRAVDVLLTKTRQQAP
jgi:FkbM family methyltransferase